MKLWINGVHNTRLIAPTSLCVSITSGQPACCLPCSPRPGELAPLSHPDTAPLAVWQQKVQLEPSAIPSVHKQLDLCACQYITVHYYKIPNVKYTYFKKKCHMQRCEGKQKKASVLSEVIGCSEQGFFFTHFSPFKARHFCNTEGWDTSEQQGQLVTDALQQMTANFSS